MDLPERDVDRSGMPDTGGEQYARSAGSSHSACARPSFSRLRDVRLWARVNLGDAARKIRACTAHIPTGVASVCIVYEQPLGRLDPFGF